MILPAKGLPEGGQMAYFLGFNICAILINQKVDQPHADGSS
jgi:hypothetical protein